MLLKAHCFPKSYTALLVVECENEMFQKMQNRGDGETIDGRSEREG